MSTLRIDITEERRPVRQTRQTEEVLADGGWMSKGDYDALVERHRKDPLRCAHPGQIRQRRIADQ